MTEIQNLFLQELIKLLRHRLNSYFTKIDGLHNFLNEVILIPYEEELDLENHKASLSNSFKKKNELEKYLSCDIFKVELCLFGLNQNMKPNLYITVHPNFKALKQDQIELIWIKFDDDNFKLIELREADGVSFEPDDKLWHQLISELKAEMTFGTLKRFS